MKILINHTCCIPLILVAVLSLSLFSGLPAAWAGVSVYDDVTSVNKPVKIRVLTKGKLFPQGGRLVTFSVEGKKIAENLSGGDGYALLNYTPAGAGLLTISVESDSDRDEGMLLVTGRDDRVFLIDMDSMLFENIITQSPAAGSRDALLKLSKEFRIVYLSTVLGVEYSQRGREQNEFPQAPVIKWNADTLLNRLKERQVAVHAIAAAPDVLVVAGDIERKFSFQKTRGATEVKNWAELVDHLIPPGLTGGSKGD